MFCQTKTLQKLPKLQLNFQKIDAATKVKLDQKYSLIVSEYVT